MRELLVESALRIFAHHAPLAARGIESGACAPGLWSALTEAGFDRMLSGAIEDDAPTMADALAVVTAASAYPQQTALAETVLAGFLLRRSSIGAPREAGVIVLAREDEPLRLASSTDGWKVTGRARRAAWARHSAWVVVPAMVDGDAKLVLVATSSCTIVPGANLADEPRDDLIFDGAAARAVGDISLSMDEIHAVGALVRSAQMVGALTRAMALAIEFAQLRRQFGRPIVKFQSVQHNIALLYSHHAAAVAALREAAAVVDRDASALALPIAKVRVGEAATIGAALAHQILGAVGYTREHELQSHTRRIWSWREEFGSETYWSERIGQRACAAGGDRFWSLIAQSQEAVSTRSDETLRREVREFVNGRPWEAQQEQAGTALGFNAAFSREVGRRGWIGAHWARRHGGREMGFRSRYVILEEMLAAGAPVFAHMVGERQTGPLLMRYGTEEQRARFLPRIVAGECYFCIGMSEPGAGSDLAAIQTRAIETDGGYRVTGAKIWTSLAHLADYIIILCRTSDAGPDRHGGLSQLMIDLASPGITIAPIINLAGEHEFNEVVFDDAFVPANGLIGASGNGWAQAQSELIHERGGPDRFLATFPALSQVVGALGPDPGERASIVVGWLVAHLSALRGLAQEVADMAAAGQAPAIEAAIVKEMGATFEQDVSESLRQIAPYDEDARSGRPLRSMVDGLTLHAPSYSIRGGTREILRGLIAKGVASG